MQLHHYLIILSAPWLSSTIWSLPSLAQPSSTPTPICICSILPTVHLGWMDLQPETIPIDPASHPLKPNSVSFPQSPKIAEGPPSEDKGTPGNRGGCRYNQCSAYQVKEPQPRSTPARQNLQALDHPLN